MTKQIAGRFVHYRHNGQILTAGGKSFDDGTIRLIELRDAPIQRISRATHVGQFVSVASIGLLLGRSLRE